MTEDARPQPHFCSDECREAARPCGVCLAQERSREEARKRYDGEPTLTHNPFAELLGKL